MAASIKASEQGLSTIDVARKKLGWTKADTRWHDKALVSKSTLKRFWMKKRISRDAFMSICEAVGLDWQKITDLEAGNLQERLKEGVDSWNKWKRQNPPLEYRFENEDLRKAVLNDIDFSGVSLAGANLSGASLENANLTKTDLTNANLNGASLRGANLTAAQILGTTLTGSQLTGACIQDWNINSDTELEDIKCDYIYLRYIGKTKPYTERRPNTEKFKPGEFSALFQKAIDTVDLIFKDGIDWQAFFQSFQELRTQYTDEALSIQAIERKQGGAFVVRLEISPDADKSSIESSARLLYDNQIKLLKEKYKEELASKEFEIGSYRRENQNLMQAINMMAQRPATVNITGASAGSTITINGDQDSINIQSEEAGAAIKVNGDIGNSINVQNGDPGFLPDSKGNAYNAIDVHAVSSELVEQAQSSNHIQAVLHNYPLEQGKNLAGTAKETQTLLEQLSENWSIIDVPEQAVQKIQQNPRMRERVIGALKVGGKAALEQLVDHPAISIVLAAIESTSNPT